MYPSALLSLLLASGSAVIAGGTRIGDEHYGNTEKGLFYLFGPSITIIDPDSGEIVNELSGSAGWGDVVYMRDQAQLKHYAFANDRDKHDIMVVDCDEQEIISHVDVGFSPVHLYAIPSREEVWAHADGNGTFDILHMNDIEYLAHSHLIAHAWTPGHGKLLWDPNLQDRGFATNTNENKIYELDLDEREMVHVINMTLADLDDEYQCVRTHGIAYTWVNEHLYVECSNDRDCVDYTDAANCSGSAWEVDVDMNTNPPEPVARLVSPALNAKYNSEYMGVQGQIYVTPDERYAVVPNKNQNYLHFLKPVNGKDTEIVEVEVTGTPGKVTYYPKDGADVWGPDSSLADYYVIIAQEDSEEDSGIIMIDLEEIYNAFETSEGEPNVEVTYISLGKGARYRPIARGSNYAVTPANASSAYGGYSYVSVVDLDTKEVKYNLDVPEVRRVLWVPTHDDEKVADHENRISALEDAIDSETEMIAEAALAIAVVGGFAAMLALLLAIKHGRQAKVVSGGEYKPFVCL